jgi:hypothetical protein
MLHRGLAMAIACGLVLPAGAAFGDGAPTARPGAKQRASDKPTRAKRAKRTKASRTSTRAKRRWRMERPADASSSPAVRYARLTEPECHAELAARKIVVQHEPGTRGVRMPVRLTHPLRGVEFRTNLKDPARATTPWEILDCRLVLALDDFAEILAARDIVDVRHYSVYRRPPKSWPDGKIGMRHDGALAIDAARFIARDGSYLDVDEHFGGKIGAPTCPSSEPGGRPAGPRPATEKALALREILCEAVARRLFHVVLTPNYDRAHKNHFHLEITEGWKAFLVH